MKIVSCPAKGLCATDLLTGRASAGLLFALGNSLRTIRRIPPGEQAVSNQVLRCGGVNSTGRQRTLLPVYLLAKIALRPAPSGSLVISAIHQDGTE